MTTGWTSGGYGHSSVDEITEESHHSTSFGPLLPGSARLHSTSGILEFLTIPWDGNEDK